MPHSQQAPAPSPLFTSPSLKRRLACWLYELLLLTGIVLVTGLALSGLAAIFGYLIPAKILQALLFLLVSFYFAWFWSHGQTLAMKTWNLTLVDQNGLSITKLRALTRFALACFFIFLPLSFSSFFNLSITSSLLLFSIWIGLLHFFSKLNTKKQFPHDILANTFLISTNKK